MVLLIDSGNSRVKWKEWDNLFLGSTRFSYWNEFFQKQIETLHVPDHIVVVNVAGAEKGRVLEDKIAASWACKVDFVESQRCFGGLTNGYAQWEKLGADRWVSLIGAYSLCKCPLCVVDAGTAVTIDLVTSDGQHQGGLVTPGFYSAHRALCLETAQVRPTLTEQILGEVWGRSTDECVERGVSVAIAGAINLTCRKLEAIDRRPTVILTGGDARRVDRSLLEYAVREEPDLVFVGLAEIAKSMGCGG